ncbi:MAG: hypothetical protein WCY88_06555 [Spongiibacteraceae bacterium]
MANPEITLITLLQHKQLIFDMIDHADSTSIKGVAEFSVPLYHRLIAQLTPAKNDQDKKKLTRILSLENLARNELLAYWDHKSDTFIFQDFVISMFRHLEGHRLQELSDAELNGLHVRLNNLYQDVIHSSFSWDKSDVDYQEKYGHIISTLRDISSRIDQNVTSLRGQAKHLAKLADQQLDNDIARTEQVHSALKRIFDLAERYIRPTLRFLNPDLDWKGEDNKPPLYLFQQIMLRFERRSLSVEYGMMSRIYWNLLRASEDITLVRKSLDIYINLYEDQRRLYNAIEEKYNAFYARVSSLNDGKLKGNTLDPDRGLMSEMSIISGLKSHIFSQAALINLPTVPGTAYLDEHLRVRLNRIKELQRGLIDGADQSLQIDHADIEKRSRFVKLHNAAKKIQLVPDKDIYLQIHQYLKSAFPDYQLSDLIDVYSMAVADKHNINICLTNIKTITYLGRVLTYRLRLLSKEIHTHD